MAMDVGNRDMGGRTEGRGAWNAARGSWSLVSGSVSLLLSFNIRIPKPEEEVRKIRAQFKLRGGPDNQTQIEALLSNLFLISVEISETDANDPAFLMSLSRAAGNIQADAEYVAAQKAGRTGFYEIAQLFQRSIVRDSGPRRVLVESAAFPNAPDIRCEFVPDGVTKVRRIVIDLDEKPIEADPVRRAAAEKLRDEIEGGMRREVQGQPGTGNGRIIQPGDGAWR